jgi:pimeloyl-ACP methyl ester carboxylesterase
MTDLTIKNGSLNLAASVYGREGAPDIMFLHGISGARDTWEEAVARLEGRFRCWTLDFRGHGDSDHADSYLIADYASDAAALLAVIARPAIVAGHSLGAVTAACLAQDPHPFVKAVFLEDPPYYMNEPKEWAKGLYSVAFRAAWDKQIEMERAGATLDDYLDFVASVPAVQGGIMKDHVGPRHLLSFASALQRHDPSSWAPALSLAVFAAFDTARPLRVPAMLIQADRDLAPAVMEGHDNRFLATNPSAKVIYYEGATHRIHATRATQQRFLDDLDAFATAQAG